MESSAHHSSSTPSFHIAGVGASAGGLEALEQLFSAMPSDTGLGFVVVQHLSPDFKSIMDELLARRTKIPVLLVEDGMLVEPNHIYLIPPKKEMIISGGRLLLSDKGNPQELTLPIDTFFRSLAQDAGHRAIAIVLSGCGSDGSRGIREVHEAGGLVIVQDETAAFDGMPKSALDTGIVDHVLAPEQIPAVLLEAVRRVEASIDGSPAAAETPTGINAVFHLLEEQYDIDFSTYKPSTIVRRIDRRLQIARAANIDDYVVRVASDPLELDALYHDLLIGVTRFFRDQEAFEILEERVIPELLEDARPGDEIRIWIPGCATGEEAYSIAILVHEAMERRGELRRVKIFATDIHSGSLEIAARGLYGADAIAHVSPARIERYFKMHGSNAQVASELRQMVVFARHNVLKDPPFTRVDLISCRNMLIYFQPLAQKKVLSLFHFALKRQGVLMLGPSETPGAFVEDFEALNSHWRIFKKQRDLPLPASSRTTRVPDVRQTHAPAVGTHYPLSQTIAVYDTLLDRHMPPSLLVNERRELIHAFGGAAKFLKHLDGRPSLDLLDMVEPDLRLVLTGSMQRALKTRAAIVYRSLRLRGAGEEERVYDLTLSPVTTRAGTALHLLITIVETGTPAPIGDSATELGLPEAARDQLRMVEAELSYTKENLQATIEELETSNEELQATNEELLASNEELQSTNEELQSVNEELYTVNAEYQKKIAQLVELTNDIDNLLVSTEVGTIFLDRQLCIRKFTPRIAETFNLLAQDVGRPIGAFTSKLNHPELMAEIVSVLESERAIERELRDAGGNWYFLRILPYRARGAVEGVVLTLIDVNGLKAAEDAAFRERYLLDSLMQSVPDLIYFKDRHGRFVRVNEAMAKRLELDRPADAIGKHTIDFLPDTEAETFDRADQAALSPSGQPLRIELHKTVSGRLTWFMTTRKPLVDRDGRIVGMFGIARDVTEQKLAEDEIRLAVTRRDQFLAMLSHELRNPLGAIVCASKLLACQVSEATPWSREIAVIERQSGQMARLLDDLLEASRITQNKIELHKRVVDVRAIAEEAITALDHTLKARRLTLSLDFPDQVIAASADPARLQQILINLLGNSAKYTPSGGHIFFSMKEENGQVVITVRDDGAGIDSEQLGSIFDLFVQGRATLARTEGGMGVGLTLVRALVEMHGGTVSAESEGIGRGSEFTVRLPISDAPLSRELGSDKPQLRLGGARRVAVIDDNADSCEMMRGLLELAGYEVHCANDGESALLMLERVRPEVAIIDIGLPGMSGYELARRLRAESGRGRPYLIALTGYGQPTDRAEAIESGFDEHLVKPLHPDQLERVLGERRSALHERFEAIVPRS